MDKDPHFSCEKSNWKIYHLWNNQEKCVDICQTVQPLLRCDATCQNQTNEFFTYYFQWWIFVQQVAATEIFFVIIKQNKLKIESWVLK